MRPAVHAGLMGNASFVDCDVQQICREIGGFDTVRDQDTRAGIRRRVRSGRNVNAPEPANSGARGSRQGNFRAGLKARYEKRSKQQADA